MLRNQKLKVWIAVFGFWALLTVILLNSCGSANSVELSFVRTWTAPGDDGYEGTAAIYDVRYTTDTLQPWGDWIIVPGVPAPDTAGTFQSFAFVLDVRLGETYFFALRAADEVPNWSERSNVKAVFIPDDMPPGRVIDFD